MSYLTPKREIEFLRDAVLPFVNCSNQDADSIIKAYAELQNNVYQLNGLKPDYAQYVIDSSKKEDRNAILSLYSFLKFMMIIPLNPTDESMVNQDYYNDMGVLESLTTVGIENFNKRISNNIFARRAYPDVVWSGLGRTVISKSPWLPNDNSLNVVEIVCVKMIANNFQSIIIDESKIDYMSGTLYGLPCTEENLGLVTAGLGFKYFGVCEKCGRLFFKQRKDHVYCSNACSTSMRMKKYRENRKRKESKI